MRLTALVLIAFSASGASTTAVGPPPARGAPRVAVPPPVPRQPEGVQRVQQAPNLPPIPSDEQCAALPIPRSASAFPQGEVLDYDVDAMGAKAAKMTMRALPAKDGAEPVEIHVETNTFFSKVRRVNGTGTSVLSLKNYHPLRYHEDAQEDDIHRVAEVTFQANHSVHLQSQVNDSKAEGDFRYAHDGLDVGGAIYFLRQAPLKEGQQICFDSYGIRRMWRVWGKVEPKEHVSLPVGEFDAWHISGIAARIDNPNVRREIHVWISDDSKHLPLAALGSIDLGTVRATLVAYTRPGEKAKAEPKANLKW